MAFGRSTRHALPCRRSPSTLLPASHENRRFSEHYLSRSIRQLHLTMWTINNCTIASTTPTTIRRWLNNYMQNSLAKVHFRQQELKCRKVKTGVVQDRVLSPALFNCYLADFPTPPPNIKLIKYANDITIYTSGSVVADLINGLNIYLSQLHQQKNIPCQRPNIQ